MKKLLALIICICLMLTTFTACGSTSAAPENAETPAAATETPAQETKPETQACITGVSDAKADDIVATADFAAAYKSVEITGTALDMDLVFSRNELGILAGYGLDYAELSGLTVTAQYGDQAISGLDLVKFLALCGDDFSVEQRIAVTNADGVTKTDISAETAGVVVLTDTGIDLAIECDYIENVQKLMVGNCCDEPHYEMHNRAPHDESADIEFTFNVYKGDELRKTVVYTTAQLEQLALDNPEAVHGSYYGVIGDVDSIPSMGAGGFLDYYEGLRFDWLLTDILGIELKGSAELYSRDGEVYTTIDDLQYFAQPESEYYSCTSDGDTVPGMAIPVLAYSKNGAPLLPEHEHDSDAYISANNVKSALKDIGVDPVEIGTVKNHSGPFVAALGNCAGYYGGYQMETSGDCVQMDIHIDEVAWVEPADVKPVSAEVTTDNNGEDAQHVNYIISFDGDVSGIKAEDFSATIAGTDVEPERISVTANGDTATLTISPSAIKAGGIEVKYTGADAVAFNIHSIVSPGMDMEIVEQDSENAAVTMRVSHLYNIRGIGRVMLVENGETVMTQTAEPAEFTGIHGHDFLNLTADGIAEKMVFSLGESFPDGYTFQNDGDTVTVTKVNPDGPTELELRIQQSLEIEIK